MLYDVLLFSGYRKRSRFTPLDHSSDELATLAVKSFSERMAMQGACKRK